MKREAIEIPGVSHGAPIPMGAKIGSIIYSSAIMGKSAENNELPLEAVEQMACLFENIEAFMVAAGGTTENIIRMSVYLKDNKYRNLFNKEWLRMFPDEHNRPARHISINESLQHGMVTQVELSGVL